MSAATPLDSPPQDIAPGGVVRALSFRRNFSWGVLGNFACTGTIPLLIVMIAKMGNPEMVGAFALAFAITTPLFQFTSLVLRDIQASDSRQEFPFGDYLRLRLISSGIGFALLVGIASGLRFTRQESLVIFVVGISKVIESLSDIFHGLFQRNERMDYVAHSMVLRTGITLCSTGLVLYYWKSLLWGVLALAFSYLASLLVYDIPGGRRILRFSGSTNDLARSALAIRCNWHWPNLQRLFRLAFPVGLFLTLLTFNSNLPRYSVQMHLGTRNLGIFAALNSISSAGITLVGTMGQAAMPRLARFYAASEMKSFRRLLVRLIGVDLLLGFAGIIGTLLFGSRLLTTVYTTEYASASSVLVWLTVSSAVAFLTTTVAYTMVATRGLKTLVVPSFILSSLTWVLCAYLVPRFGLKGAAWALTGSWLIAAIPLSIGLARGDNRKLFAAQPDRTESVTLPAVRNGFNPAVNPPSSGSKEVIS